MESKLSEISLHDKIKYWLIELGKELGYEKSYSGDSEPLIVRLGKWYDSYQPDVTWKYRGGICVFEIVFDIRRWKEVVGEICLASMAEDCTKIFVICPGLEHPEASKNYEYRMGTYYSTVGKKVGLKYGAKAIFIPYEAWEKERVEEIKSFIHKRLEKLEWT